jgi:hypothetical protein
MKKFNSISVFAIILSSAIVSSCATTLPIPVVKKAPERYMEVMGNKKRVGIVLGNVQTVPGMGKDDFRSSIESETVQAVQKAGYFTIVDLESRKKRMEEIAYTQSGMTNEMRAIGQEVSADGLLYINAPQPPRADCKVEINHITEKVCTAYDASNKCLRYTDRQRTESTGKLTVALSVSGKLVNIETGEALLHSYNESTEYKSSSGDPSCPSVLSGISSATKKAATSIAEGLSPVVEEYKVPVYDDADGVDKANKSQVQDQLKAGLKWADGDSKDFTAAAKSWTQALQLSGGKSVNANWNLAVYQWSKKDFNQAENYFQAAFRLGGPEFMTSKRRDIYQKFQDDRKWNQN